MTMLALVGVVWASAFVIGAALGSFINVVVYRYQTGARIGNDRSRCLSCGKQLTAAMLVPVLSFLWQKGRCAYCMTKLSFQYPLVEATAGMLALIVLWSVGGAQALLSIQGAATYFADMGFFLALLAIVVYDMRHKIIPDMFVLVLAVFSLLHVYASVHWGERQSLPSLMTGLGVSAPFLILWLISRGRWMGLGDAKLALPLGFFLGYPFGASMPVLAFWGGTIPAIALLLFRKGTTMRSEVPFGPFLALATLVLYVFPIDILGLHALFPLIHG